MAETRQETKEAARRVAISMADPATPFIFDEWYVAGFGEEIGRDLIARTLLGRPVVLFRSTIGQVVALEEVRSSRWLALDRPERHYEAHAELLSETDAGARIRVRLRELSGRLDKGDWLDGGFSAGDLLMVHALLRLGDSGLIEEHPNLSDYVACAQARPA